MKKKTIIILIIFFIFSVIGVNLESDNIKKETVKKVEKSELKGSAFVVISAMKYAGVDIDPNCVNAHNLLTNDKYTSLISFSNLVAGDLIGYDWTGDGNYDHVVTIRNIQTREVYHTPSGSMVSKIIDYRKLENNGRKNPNFKKTYRRIKFK